jgi:hypothetical protein
VANLNEQVFFGIADVAQSVTLTVRTRPEFRDVRPRAVRRKTLPSLSVGLRLPGHSGLANGITNLVGSGAEPVTWCNSDGSSKQFDYSRVGTLTFAPGELSRTIVMGSRR